MEERNCREDRENAGVFVSHWSPQENAQVVRRVGRMCTVTCLLNWLETDAYIRDMAELLGVDGLELKAANEAELPYEG